MQQQFGSTRHRDIDQPGKTADIIDRRGREPEAVGRHVRIEETGEVIGTKGHDALGREARGRPAILALFQARGTIPHLVADFEDRYRLCDDGRWRIAERHIRRIFEAPDNPGPVHSGG